MKQAEITIGGKIYPVEVNMSTVLMYEEIVDESFFGERFVKLSRRVALIVAAAMTVDEKVQLDFKDIIENHWKDIGKAFNTVMELVAEFFEIPKLIADAEKQEASEKGEKGEEHEKN